MTLYNHNQKGQIRQQISDKIEELDGLNLYRVNFKEDEDEETTSIYLVVSGNVQDEEMRDRGLDILGYSKRYRHGVERGNYTEWSDEDGNRLKELHISNSTDTVTPPEQED